MGASITFENGEYFRDAYNLCNLAWVVKESYWQCKDNNAMMKRLALITDDEIKIYVETKVSEAIKKGEAQDGEKEWTALYKKKRDFLKKLLDKGELKVSGWSV
jgi:hypothetical protein